LSSADRFHLPGVGHTVRKLLIISVHLRASVVQLLQ